MKKLITQEQVKDLFDYFDGELLRKKSSPRSRNPKKGDKAGYLLETGYMITSINGKRHLLHRLIYLYHHGYFPAYLDHIDGNRANNKISNLRECTRSQNGYNSKIPMHNTSGIKGVSWCKVSRKWVAKIKFRKRCVYLGSFWDIDVAAQVIRIERIRLHGEFANHG